MQNNFFNPKKSTEPFKLGGSIVLDTSNTIKHRSMPCSIFHLTCFCDNVKITFKIYMDDFSKILNDSGIGCYVDNVCIITMCLTLMIYV